jgi:hypothetical protein
MLLSKKPGEGGVCCTALAFLAFTLVKPAYTGRGRPLTIWERISRGSIR